jgi:nitrate/nitrite transporter NarK
MPSLALVIVGVAFGCSFGAVCYPIALPIIFGSRAYRGIIGILSAALSLGSIFSPIVTGYIFDHYGSYNPAFIFCIIVMVIVTALQPLVFKKKGI